MRGEPGQTPGGNTSSRSVLPENPQRQTARSTSQIYAQYLLLKMRGFPLWIPQPSGTLSVPYRRHGLSIGDVGIIKPSGCFSFLFNICLPPSHPLNSGKVPAGFSPLDPPLDPDDILQFTELQPSSYLASASIEKRGSGSSTYVPFP